MSSHDQQEAERLARIVRAYWMARALSPLVWVERQGVTSSATDARAAYVIRSDMVGGQPQTIHAVPKVALKIVPAPQIESARPFAALAAIGQRENGVESHGPSNRVWRDVARRGVAW